jgi:hypothetical protein
VKWGLTTATGPSGVEGNVANLGRRLVDQLAPNLSNADESGLRRKAPVTQRGRVATPDEVTEH